MKAKLKVFNCHDCDRTLDVDTEKIVICACSARYDCNSEDMLGGPEYIFPCSVCGSYNPNSNCDDCC